MIDEIRVHNLALIRDASLQPCEGLTVITGETGAGKTALLSALKLLMGSRASADMVRDGEDSLTVSGRFFDADTDIVVTRRVGADGRSRANINGEMASMSELAHLVAPSIDLCGQFEHQQLMRTGSHVRLLDAWSGESVASALEAYQQAYLDAEAAAKAVAQVEEAARMSSAQIDDARFTLRRIDEVAPGEGEYEQLAHDLEIAEHAETLARAASTAHEALSGDDGALDALNAAASALESAGRIDSDLSALAQSLREAGFIMEDVAASARDYREAIEFDADMLAAQQERFSLMQGLLRAYGPRMEDVLRARERAAETVSLVDDSEARLVEAQRAASRAEAALAESADALDAARAETAPRFAAAVTEVMGRLEMGSAELVCSQERLSRQTWTENGPSRIEFLYRPSSAMHPRPLARIASGGEVSRVMLATKVVLGAQDDVETLVFDEVDAGVGGAVAVALAEVIAELARTHQVIVVTHLAQVAVRGDAHFVVRREELESGSETAIAPVTGASREAEIARMLSGSVTDTSLAHARELLTSV